MHERRFPVRRVEDLWRRRDVSRQLGIVSGVSSALFLATARVVFRHLADEEADSHTINMAGRQRMLSQRMAREALAFAAGDEGALGRLDEVAEEFSATLGGLLHGDPTRGLPPSAGEAHRQLTVVEQHWQQMMRAVSRLRNEGHRPRIITLADAVVGQADVLMTASDHAVSAFDAAFASKVQRLRRRMILLGVGGSAILAVTYVALLTDATRRAARAEAEVARKERALQQLAEERRELVRRLLDVSEEERRRAAAAIHDGPTQQLIAASMLLDAAGTSAGPAVAAEQVVIARGYLESAIEEMRRLIADLRPPLLDDFGVAEALVRALTPIARDTNVDLRVDTAGLNHRLDPRTEVALYRVAHEAATNAIRHSGSPTVLVEIRDGPGEPHRTILTVVDEGSGFDPDAVFASSDRRPLGLLSMRERAELLGGGFHINSRVGEGTTVTAWIPSEIQG